ncbi:MAG: hypothetical protein PHY93_02415 [Bacteriovorax sp.]|nr:hypothetical protein [Bacteriovorax sp.]
MKSHWNHLRHLILSLSLVVSSSSAVLFPSVSWTQTDTSLDQQKADCAKNTAAEWSATTNKCVGKVEDRQARHDANDCNLISDLTKRAECHKKLAEQKTGLSSDPNSLNQGGTTESMMMNGVGTAYAIIGMINGVGKEGKSSECTSKKIFGVTAAAGFASDIFLKIRAKKKVNELQDKYKLEVKQGAYDAQVKALQYLKEEQQTVADIASLEKKRNMVLMLGYGAASIMAIYEMATMGASNAGCFKPDPKPEATPTPTPATVAAQKDQTDTKTGTDAKTEDPDAKTYALADQSEVKAQKLDSGQTISAEATTTPAPTTVTASGPAGVSIDHTTQNGKQFLDIKNDPVTGARSSVIDNNIVDYKSGKVLGTVDYSKGVINYNNGGPTLPINTVNSTSFSAPVSVGGKGLSGNGLDWRSVTCRAGKC